MKLKSATKETITSPERRFKLNFLFEMQTEMKLIVLHEGHLMDMLVPLREGEILC